MRKAPPQDASTLHASSADVAPDPVALTRSLIRCPSVTPAEGGALSVLEQALKPFGFNCVRVDRGAVSNLYARFGDGGRVFGFSGHTDVVPVGDPTRWSEDPFGAAQRDGVIYGRGACDMKSGVAAFVAAACAEAAAGTLQGSVALAITGDEEGDCVDGTRALLDWMSAAGERFDVCLVGEPTSRERLGDVIKIGRRGSMTVDIRASGRQGHTAYPQKALNPLPALVKLLDRLASAALDEGSAHFEPSTLALTTIDVGNPANNVVPASATARLNIRFNDHHSSDSLSEWIERERAEAAAASGVTIELSTRVSGESFLTEPGPLSDLVRGAVAAETGLSPVLETGGGTSDARFIQAHCPVVEFGLTGSSMHQVDENVSSVEIHALTQIYRRILRDYWEAP